MVGLVVSSLLILTLGSLAAGAGVGGGALYVTIFNLLLVKYIKAAVPLSKSTILGAAIGNFMALAYQRHPHADRPKIDYEIATFMQSGELLGVTLGVLLNMLLPDLVIKIFMVLLLTYNSYKTINKGISKYKKETEKMQKGQAEKELEDGIEETNGEATAGRQESNAGIVKRSMSSDLGSTAASSDNIELTYDMNVVEGSESNATALSDENVPQRTPEQAAELKKLQEEAAVTFPRWAYAIILSMTAYTIAYALLKQEVFNPCSDYYPVGYWLWYFTPVPVLMLCMVATGLILLRNHERREKAGWKYLKEDTYQDMQWSREQLLKFPISAIFAGIAAGLVGIGGGMVIGPLFMMINLEATVGTASCAYMILWTASSGVLQYYVAGKIHWTFILYFGAFGFASGQIGQRGVDAVLKKFNRPSYVVFLLAFIIVAACTVMAITGLFNAIEDHKNGENLFEISTDDFKCTKCNR